MFSKVQQKSLGVSLVEILLAMAIAAVFIGGASVLIGSSLRSSQNNREIAVASGLLNEGHEAITGLVNSGWNNIYLLNKGVSNHYKLNRTSDLWEAATGDETITVNGLAYTRYFVVENISRTNDVIDVTYNSVNEDPSFQRITVYIKWGDANNPHILSLPKYLGRTQNMRSFVQSDWSGGSGESNVLLQPNTRYSSGTNITNITN